MVRAGLVCFLALLLTALSGCYIPRPRSGSGPSGYKIELYRPHDRDRPVRLSGEVEVRFGMSGMFGGQMIADTYESARIRYQLERTVLPSSSEYEVRFQYMVRSFTAEVDGQSQSPLEPGDIIKATVTRSSTRIDELPPVTSEAIEYGIEFMFEPLDFFSEAEQALLAPEGRVQIGESWDVNSEHIQRVLGESVFSFRNAELVSQARLVDVEDVGGTECIYFHIQIEGSGVDFNDLPAGVITDKSDVFLAYSTHLPVDKRLWTRDVEVLATIEFEGHANNGADAAMSYSVRGKIRYEEL